MAGCPANSAPRPVVSPASPDVPTSTHKVYPPSTRSPTCALPPMQELGGKEAEAQQLRQLLEGYQQKVHALEVQNYSLALHLKQATDSRDPLRSNQNPDVF